MVRLVLLIALGLGLGCASEPVDGRGLNSKGEADPNGWDYVGTSDLGTSGNPGFHTGLPPRNRN